MAERTVVLVHGAWHGGWCWEKVTPLLDEAGVRWRTVDLPMTALADDIATVTAVLDDVAGPVLLVGHSYGGVVITGAGVHPSVEHLVFIAGFPATEDESAAAAVPDAGIEPSALGDAFKIADDGGVTLEHDGAIATLFNRCSPSDAAAAFERLRPIAIGCLKSAPGVAAWRDTPSTYVLCLDDQGVPSALQRVMAERARSEIVELDTDHSPFYAEPEALAALLVERA
jgi:pimeloyl-ACP methyl ester carboxylesterase